MKNDMKSVVVPVEPTQEMIDAGWNDAIQSPMSIYRSMVTAAPAPSSLAGGEVPYELNDLCREVCRRYPSAFNGSDPIAANPPSLENATDLFLAVCFAHLAALTPRQEAPAAHVDLARLQSEYEVCPTCNRAGDEAPAREGVSEGELRDALGLILPLAKGYAAAHPVGSNQSYVDYVEGLIALTPRHEAPARQKSGGEIDDWTADDLETLISDAISDSMDVDWTSGEGAKAVLQALNKEGLLLAPFGPSFCHEAPAALCDHGHTDPMALCSDCEAAKHEAPAEGAGERVFGVATAAGRHFVTIDHEIVGDGYMTYAAAKDASDRLQSQPLRARSSAPAEGAGERERLADAYIAGAMSVHEYWTENPGEAPRGDPEFDEAAGDYAYSILSDLRARSSAPEAREGEALAWACTTCNSPRAVDPCPKCGTTLTKPADGWDWPRLPDIDRIRELAREVGYAVGVHGTMERDLDLIAAPWVAEAVTPLELAQHIATGLKGHVLDYETQDKPCGRWSCNINLYGWFKLIDLSVMPTHPAAPSADKLRIAVEALVPALDAIDEPAPKPLPEQSSRVAEAMAGKADDEARRQWEKRVYAAKNDLVFKVRQALSALKAEGAK